MHAAFVSRAKTTASNWHIKTFCRWALHLDVVRVRCDELRDLRKQAGLVGALDHQPCLLDAGAAALAQVHCPLHNAALQHPACAELDMSSTGD